MPDSAYLMKFQDIKTPFKPWSRFSSSQQETFILANQILTVHSKNGLWDGQLSQDGTLESQLLEFADEY